MRETLTNLGERLAHGNYGGSERGSGDDDSSGDRRSAEFGNTAWKIARNVGEPTKHLLLLKPTKAPLPRNNNSASPSHQKNMSPSHQRSTSSSRRRCVVVFRIYHWVYAGVEFSIVLRAWGGSFRVCSRRLWPSFVVSALKRAARHCKAPMMRKYIFMWRKTSRPAGAQITKK